MNLIFSYTFILFTVTLISLVSAQNDWRGFSMGCPHLDYSARFDPIIAPSSLAQHYHDFVGSMPVSPNLSTQDLLNNDCSACTNPHDKSVYWYPTLFQKLRNGQIIHVKPIGVTVYYQIPGKFKDVVKAIPEGLKLVIGDPAATSKPPLDKAWNIFIYNDGKEEPDSINDFAPKMKNLKRLTIFSLSQSCIKEDYDRSATDHSQFAKFADQLTDCPPGYFRIPNVNMHPSWDFKEPISWDSPDEIPLRFSSKSTKWGNGYTYHTDFMSGWKLDKFQSLVQKCNGSALTQCNDEKQSQQAQDKCKNRAIESAKSNLKAGWSQYGLAAVDNANPADMTKMIQQMDTSLSTQSTSPPVNNNGDDASDDVPDGTEDNASGDSNDANDANDANNDSDNSSDQQVQQQPGMSDPMPEIPGGGNNNGGNNSGGNNSGGNNSGGSNNGGNNNGANNNGGINSRNGQPRPPQFQFRQMGTPGFTFRTQSFEEEDELYC